MEFITEQTGSIEGESVIGVDNPIANWIKVATEMIRNTHPETRTKKITWTKIDLTLEEWRNVYLVKAEFTIGDEEIATQRLQQRVEQGAGSDAQALRQEEGHVGVLREGEQIRRERAEPQGKSKFNLFKR